MGYHLTKALSESGYSVYALVRAGSEHNNRIKQFNNVSLIEISGYELGDTCGQIPSGCDFLINLVWTPADRYDYESQMKNAYYSIKMLELTYRVKCRRYVGIGSQAEYGVASGIVVEDTTPCKPVCGYGASKVASCCFTRRRAEELGLEWVWGRLFSVYGEYEPKQRLIPHIMNCLEEGDILNLSSCRQNWDFLYGTDAGEALLALAEQGRNGKIYNIADGRYRPLRDYVYDIVDLYDTKSEIRFGADPDPFVSLQPSVDKLKEDTGWYPKVSFADGIKELMIMKNELK